MSKEIKLKNWSAKHQEAYKWLFNYYKTINEEADFDNYIDKDRKYLMTVIENNPNWSDSSKERLLFMVSRYLHNKGKVRYSNIYQKKGIEYIKKKNEVEYKNQLDDKELLNFRPHDYFVNILKTIDYDAIDSKVEHMKYLLLSILTYQPPLRTSFYTSAKFIRLEKDNNNKDNFVQITKRGKLKVMFIVNNDKVSKTKTYAMNKNLNFIKIIDESLVKLINDSYEKHPRTYLFEMNDKPITSNTLLKWLREITKVSEINVDIMRASYITWYYSKYPSYADREELSKMMRHSVQTAMKNYNKIVDEQIIKNNETIEGCDDVKQEVIKQQDEIADLKLKLEAYTNESADKEDLKHYKKKRTDIIYNLNKKGREPREDTLKKYNIVYDKVKGLYV